MEFQKIQLTRKNTLNVVFKNEDGDIVTVNGANLVHRDFRQAMQALIPHLAIITEQRESLNRNLKQIQADRITDEGNNSVFKRLEVDCVSFSEDETEVSVHGCRILLSGGVVKLETPTIELGNSDSYQYRDELSLDLDAIKYEAKQYIEEKKWGIKQAEIQFESPFEGVKADEAPEVPAEGKKRGRPKKQAAA